MVINSNFINLNTLNKKNYDKNSSALTTKNKKTRQEVAFLAG